MLYANKFNSHSTYKLLFRGKELCVLQEVSTNREHSISAIDFEKWYEEYEPVRKVWVNIYYHKKTGEISFGAEWSTEYDANKHANDTSTCTHLATVELEIPE